MSLTNMDVHDSDEQDTHSSLNEGTAESDEASFYTCYSAYTNPQRPEVDLHQNDTVHGSESEESQRLLSSGETSPQPGPSGDRFANIDRFRPWFPQCDPEHPRAVTMSVRLSKQTTALKIQILVSLAILALNISLTVWAATKEGLTGGMGVIYRGDCRISSRYNTVLHLVINALSTGLLGASNYCSQILIAPSRKEVDIAHAKGIWLDIGVQSVRNLSNISWRRRCAWVTLMFSSVLLHLFWNSALYSSTPVFVYTTAIVSNDFQSNRTPWSDSLEALENLQRNMSSLEKLDNMDCIRRYMDALGSPRDLVVVTNYTSDPTSAFQPNSSLIVAFQNPAQGENWFRGPRWICSEVYHKFKNDEKQCTVDLMQDHAENWQIWMEPLPDPVTVEYCLSAGVQATKHCDVRYNISIWILICILNFCKCVCIMYARCIHAESRLVTVGDAVASFLEQADETTKRFCLATVHTMRKVGGPTIESSENVSKIKKAGVWIKKHVAQAVRGLQGRRNPTALAGALWPAAPKRRGLEKGIRWYSTAEKSQWLITCGSCTLVIFVVIYLLVSTLVSQTGGGLSVTFPSLWARGFGRPSSANIVLSWKVDWTVYTAVLLANSFQVLLSLLYILYNQLLTSLLIASEWASYGFERKALRVSSPRGIQRSSYFLSLPFKFGIPLMLSSSLLHWLISQSVFVIATTGIDSDGAKVGNYDAFAIGYSSIGIVFTLCVGGIMVLALIGIGCFRQPGDAADVASDGSIDASKLSRWKLIFRVEQLSEWWNRKETERLKWYGEGWTPPLASTCSAAISAACHRPAEDVDAHLFPVRWGDVGEYEDTVLDDVSAARPHHCCFTTARDVSKPVSDKEYV